MGAVTAPLRYEAIGESLAAGSASLSAFDEAGRNLARDGVSLSEAMEGLRVTTQAVRGRDPEFTELQVLLHAWSEATLAHLHQISCEDPLTGLASRAHVRSRIAELQRAAGAVGAGQALVVLDAQRHGIADLMAPLGGLSRSLHLVQLAQTTRSVFGGSEVIAQIAPDRIVVLAERDDRLNRRVSLLRRMLDATAEPGTRTAVWVEGVPDNDAGAAALLDELARC